MFIEGFQLFHPFNSSFKYINIPIAHIILSFFLTWKGILFVLCDFNIKRKLMKFEK